jgi:hypothetical protein
LTTGTEPMTEPALEPLTSCRSDDAFAPGATIEVRRVDAAGGVIVTVAGVVGRNDSTAR